MRYVRDHLDTGITIIADGRGKNIVVTADIAVSFGCYDDESHTGMWSLLVHEPVFVGSVKKHIVTKSSTEA